MKDRRPRKLKKRLKRRYAAASAVRIVRCAMTTAVSLAQTAMIMSRPTQKHDPFGKAAKLLNTAEVAMDCAEAISQIMNSGPKNWREA
jgi:hypothetical protein